MNFVIAGIVVILIMLCIVAGLMIALIKKLEDLESTLDIIKFGVKDVLHADDELIKNEIHSMIDLVDRLINIEKEFDSGITESTGKLVDVCKTHLCAIEDRCKGTEQMVVNCTASIAGTAEAVKSLRESTDTLEEQVTAITDYIREKSVEKDQLLDQEAQSEPICKSCAFNDESGMANVCIYCSERSDHSLFQYEPKNAFEQAGDV